MKATHQKVSYNLKPNTVYFVLAKFFQRNVKSCSVFFDIECSGSYRPFLSKKLQVDENNKTLLFTLFYHFKKLLKLTLF